MYKINPFDLIIREDGLVIPRDPLNRHYQEFLAWEAEGNVAEPLEVPVLIPSVTPAQAKLALDDSGLLDDVETVVNNHPVRAVKIWYENANYWERGNPYVQALGIELGLTEEQIDELFVAASKK